ncbi:MAG: transporter [Candidatus Pacearchaeota archaeon]|nr:MAG: transporter [Candidatus Pacearchaeota archaeon]
MALFKIKNSNVTKLSTIDLEKEKNIQTLFEQNLFTILNVDFLATEYSTSFGGRIDTLGIDKIGSPVIIEYKRNQNDNVINQSLSYLRWLLDHKADFEILCRNKKIDIKIDWTSPRVICVAESYNKFDLDTVEILPIKIELLKYRIYEDDILFVESESQKAIRISTTKIFKKGKREKEILTKLQKNYTLETHLQVASKEIKELFMQLKEMITSLDDSIIEEAKAKYIAYKLTTNFVDIVIQKNAIKAFLNVPSGKLNDSFGIARDLTKPKIVGHWGNGDYEVLIKNKEELIKLFELIKQSYNYNK